MAEEGLAFENLMKMTTVMNFITNVLIPEELWKVVPLVAFLDKQVEINKKAVKRSSSGVISSQTNPLGLVEGI